MRKFVVRLLLAGGIVSSLGCLGLVVILLYVTILPVAGAAGADWLRQLIGDKAVAQLETTVFQIQDTINQQEVKITKARPAAPWLPATPAALPAPTPFRRANHSSSPEELQRAPSPAWIPEALSPFGSLPGEGQWQAFISTPEGKVSGYRTFLQPDPQRPFTRPAIVIIDLAMTRLHFVPGSLEPASNAQIERRGQIDPRDQQPGRLLAAFNGGFKANHGHFGAMTGGVILLNPVKSMGTIAVFADDNVRMGEWGTEINPEPDMIAWRQNGPLIIHHGEINPRTADADPKIWGYVVGGDVATWRSGIGLSANGNKLIYAAGQGLTLTALARTLWAVGADQAMQLDINNYWVHFDAFYVDSKNELQPTPLISDMQQHDDRRYLRGFMRDFFYLTVR